MMPAFAWVLVALVFFTLWMVAMVASLALADALKARRQRREAEARA